MSDAKTPARSKKPLHVVLVVVISLLSVFAVVTAASVVLWLSLAT